MGWVYLYMYEDICKEKKLLFFLVISGFVTHRSKKHHLGRGVGWRTLYGPPVGFWKGLQWKPLVILGCTMPYDIRKGCLEGHFTKYLCYVMNSFSSNIITAGLNSTLTSVVCRVMKFDNL